MQIGYTIDIINFLTHKQSEIELNNKYFKVPELFIKNDISKLNKQLIKEALIFNKNLLMENFILPNKLKFPISRNILENYFN